MKVHDLKTLISPELYKVLEKKVDELTPPQKQSIEKGLLLGKNLLIVSPTASGKTLIAEIGLINSILTRVGKGVYVAPMRALVREKFEEFSKDYPFVKIAMSIGDFDSYDFYLRDYDLIFVSTEKLDSL
ncbi:MAG: DEAD/DEAH box helicase, partial [archaeon]